ncbi:hypothetical protein Acid345_1092 [Candidatus Koribacter versatilis Ellin345]|uniref:Uncharacterized protein n=1 Tax=Koribacter versatilis (strain Ellin345) TaxID=204669 RepID=Q1ISQ5_KORVE|nr:hypothetical protein [Candidatus Koribacter versatilis]ABF40095.1 hypothetical protein Acid345_1092 [Candidatus Koribacter versatilis Ellin345]
MSILFGGGSEFRRIEYKSEAEFERCIVDIQHRLFGPSRFYLDIKRKIGVKGGVQNIPDGYLLDLSGPTPRLYVVENELKAHDPLRHVAVQILQFSISFESEPLAVKRILLSALNEQPSIREACEKYAPARGYRNLDHLIEYMVAECPFAALVIIDEMPESLQSVLSQRFRFGVEVLEVACYEDKNGGRLFLFEPFLADVVGDTTADQNAEGMSAIDTSEIDTLVVPAREDGFEEVFLRENRWYAVRIHDTMRPQIKYLAAYQVHPVSAITFIAPVQSIEPWKESGKYVLNFAEPARPVGPLALVKGGQVRPLQGPRYATHKAIVAAKTLDDVWKKQQ